MEKIPKLQVLNEGVWEDVEGDYTVTKRNHVMDIEFEGETIQKLLDQKKQFRLIVVGDTQLRFNAKVREYAEEKNE